MPRSVLLFGALATALVVSPALRSVRTPPGPRPGGHLLIVGGGEQSDELVTHFVALAGGPGHARIAVLPMASSEAEATGQEKADELRGLGADVFVLNLTRAEAEDDSVARLLDSATGVWFTGGDQSRLTPILLGTPVLRAIHARYALGGVIGGTSAGAAIMSDSMITGNQTRPDDTTGYYGDDFPLVGRRLIEVTPGLGFLPGAIVDQHFIKRQRSNRLLAAVLERPTLIGVGIDESTALEVDPDGRWRVLGESAALIFDARRAAVTPAGARTLGALNVRLHLLPAGSIYDPRTGRASLPAP